MKFGNIIGKMSSQKTPLSPMDANTPSRLIQTQTNMDQMDKYVDKKWDLNSIGMQSPKDGQKEFESIINLKIKQP